jgi:hypothetical protein
MRLVELKLLRTSTGVHGVAAAGSYAVTYSMPVSR